MILWYGPVGRPRTVCRRCQDVVCLQCVERLYYDNPPAASRRLHSLQQANLWLPRPANVLYNMCLCLLDVSQVYDIPKTMAHSLNIFCNQIGVFPYPNLIAENVWAIRLCRKVVTHTSRSTGRHCIGLMSSYSFIIQPRAIDHLMQRRWQVNRDPNKSSEKAWLASSRDVVVCLAADAVA